MLESKPQKFTPKPEWLRVSAPDENMVEKTEKLLRNLSLTTVCEQAACPNRTECFGCKTATFMILGSNCTRNCTFCNVEKKVPQQVDNDEPSRIAQAVKQMGLRHVVITSVTRDDLPDGGAQHFANVIRSVRNLNGDVTVEVLIPDLLGDQDALLMIVNQVPEVLNHNIETVPRLYSEVRPMAQYERSLKLIKSSKVLHGGIPGAHKMLTKSGIMVGLGETHNEVIQVMKDLRDSECDLLTIGQYLAPSKQHHEVIEYVHPDTFKSYEHDAYSLGFKHVWSGPLVRSSYKAAVI